MFTPGKRISGNPLRVRCFVGDYYDFAGTGQHVYPHITAHLTFGFGNIFVPRPDNDVDGFQRIRTICIGSDSTAGGIPPNA